MCFPAASITSPSLCTCFTVPGCHHKKSETSQLLLLLSAFLKRSSKTWLHCVFTLVSVRDTCTITALSDEPVERSPVTQKIQSFPLKSVLLLIISPMMQPTDQMSTGTEWKRNKVKKATGRKAETWKEMKAALEWLAANNSKQGPFLGISGLKFGCRADEAHNPIMGANTPLSPSWGCLAHSVKSCLQNEKSLSPADTLIPGNGFQCSDSSGRESGRYQAAVKAVSATHRCRKIRLSVDKTHRVTLNIQRTHNRKILYIQYILQGTLKGCLIVMEVK